MSIRNYLILIIIIDVLFCWMLMGPPKQPTAAEKFGCAKTYTGECE